MELIVGSFIAAALLILGHLAALVRQHLQQHRRRR
jgi:hypothetical protein